ncbi:hypothetical protein TWF281_011220 [Arthrobotrys megalospora]
MSSETPAQATPNTRTTNISNTSKPSSGTVRDLNAHEWSQAVIDELQHIQVATPPIKEIGPASLSESMNNDNNTNIHTSRPVSKQDASHPRRFPQEPVESTSKHPASHNQRNNGQLEIPQRPQAGTMESTATIDIVKQIPGGW